MGRAIVERKIERLLAAMQERFHSDSGYALITYPENIYTPPGSNQERFISKGGIVLPFYDSREAFTKQVRSLRYGF